MSAALILFAHGARDPEWATPLRRVQALVREARPDAAVDLAFLEFMAPTLEESVAARVAAGARRIVVLPMFLAQGGHLKRDLPEMLDRLRQVYPDVAFSLEPAIGEQAGVQRAMAEAACLFLPD